MVLNFLIYYFYKNIGYINISNIDLYTENGYTYFFYFNFIIQNEIPIIEKNQNDLLTNVKVCVRGFSTKPDDSYSYLNIHQVNVNDVSTNQMIVDGNVFTTSDTIVSNMYQFDNNGNVIT